MNADHRLLITVLLTLSFALIPQCIAGQVTSAGSRSPAAGLPRYPSKIELNGAIEELRDATSQAEKAIKTVDGFGNDISQPSDYKALALLKESLEALKTTSDLRQQTPLLFAAFSAADDVRANELASITQILAVVGQHRVSPDSAIPVIAILTSSSSAIFMATKTLSDLLLEQILADSAYAGVFLKSTSAVSAVARP